MPAAQDLDEGKCPLSEMFWRMTAPDSTSHANGDAVFANCLANQGEGHAFYFEVSGKELKPGVCGYFDKKRDWNTIAQITDQASLDKYVLLSLASMISGLARYSRVKGGHADLSLLD